MIKMALHFFMFVIFFCTSAALLADDCMQEKISLKKIQQMAEANNIESQFMLGYIYFRGDIIKPNYPEALKWFRKAAEQNHSASKTILNDLKKRGS